MRSPGDSDEQTDHTDHTEHPDAAEPGSAPVHAAGFAAALLGVLLAGITPNPPVTWLGWVQLAGASLMTGTATILAARGRWPSSLSPPFVALKGRVRRGSLWLAVGVLVTTVVAVGAQTLVGPLRGVYYQAFGCPPATQLRMLAGPETLPTARELAAGYERSTAEADHGCPSARIYVFEATAATIRDKLGSGDGWAGSGALREVGPQPDPWLASTGHEVDTLPAGAGPFAHRSTVARSPLVLAVPAPATAPEVGWPELFAAVTERDQRVVRPDPTSGELGLLATALLYGDRAEAGDPPLDPEEIERRIDFTLDATDVLCGLRTLPEGAPAAVITSEQQVARFNSGMRLGGTCGPTPEVPQDRRLVALYPTDTADQDLQLVELRGNDSRREAAVTAFRDWLLGDDGGSALVAAGLRPIDSPAFSAPLVADFGVDPTDALSSQPLPAQRWTAAGTEYTTARRPSRLLFLLDTSGSMATPETDPVSGTTRTRGQIAAEAVRSGLTRLGARDDFGLWFFPGGTASGYTEAVPIGPRTDARLAAAGSALTSVGLGGSTPLFQTMIDGVTALPDDDAVGVRALVVLTDGPVNTRARTASDAAKEVAGAGVRIDLVTLGEIRCAGGGLPTIVGATGGDCRDAGTATVAAQMQEVVAGRRGGR